MSDEIKDIMERLYKQGFADGVAAAKRGDTAMNEPVFAADAQAFRAAYNARFPNAGRLGVSSGFASASAKKPPPMTAENLAKFRERFPNSNRLKA